MSLLSSLVVHYKLYENADNTTVVDEKGLSNGIATRNTSLLHTTGKIGDGCSERYQ
jgi:hypothetical protein